MLSLAEAIDMLGSITGEETPLPTNVPLADLGLGSIDLLEWMFQIEEQLDLEVGLIADAEVEVEMFGDLTLAELYDYAAERLRGSTNTTLSALDPPLSSQ